MNEVTVLIPTYNRDIDNAIKLIKKLNVNGKCIIANQVDNDSVLNNDKFTLANNTSRGVNVNRDILLDNVQTEYCSFIDDCAIMDNYEPTINETFDKNEDAEVIIFSRYSEDDIFPSVTLKDRRAKRSYQISKMGGSSVAIKRDAIHKYRLSFNEKLGTPNYFFSGEGSLSLYEHKKSKSLSTSIQIFALLSSNDKSSYFKTYDSHFFESVGGVLYLLHHKMYPFYYIKQSISYNKKNIFLKYFSSSTPNW